MGLFLFNIRSIKARKASILAFIFVLSSLVSIMSPVTTFAAQKISTMDPPNAAAAFVYYKALRTCMTEGYLKNYLGGPGVNWSSMSANDAVTYEWFYSNTGAQTASGTNSTDVGVYGDTRPAGDGQYKCYQDDQGKAFLKKLVSLTGYSSGPEFLCAVGFTRQESGAGCTSIIAGADNDFIAPSDMGAKLDDWWLGIIGATNKGASGIGAGEYVLYYESFLKACGVTPSSTGIYTVMAPAASNKSLEAKKFGIADRNKSTSTSVRLYAGTTKTCGELAGFLNADNGAVKKYVAWLAKGNTYTKPTDGALLGGTSSSSTSCAVEGIGWIICPVFNFLGRIADASYNMIEGFLKTDITIFNTTSGTYTAWQAMRSLANIGFVIVFLIIVFSQLTGAGISNYGVKKMLPRLIIAAILVNVSYFICQIAVDLSNILGGSLKTLMDSLPVFTKSSYADTLATGSVFTNVVIGVLAGQTTAGVAVTAGTVAYFGGLALLIPIILAAVVAVLLVIFILIARQALIILLIALSPLAFLAMLLPNTENYFKQWRKIFIALLVLYPAVALIFGGSRLASAILVQNADFTTQLTGLAVLVLPLFAIIPILKGSLNAVPIAGNLASKWSSKANGLVGKQAKQGYQKSTFGIASANRKQLRQQYRNKQFAEGVAGGGIRSLLAKGIPTPGAGKYANEAIQRSAIAASDKADSEEVSAAETLLRTQHQNPTTLIKEAKGELADAVNKGDTVRARAAQNILLNSGGKGIAALHEQIQASFSEPNSKNSMVGQSLRRSLNSAGLKSKNNALASWAYDEQTIGESSTKASTFEKLSDSELGGHAIANLRAANNAVTADGERVLDGKRAARILQNPVVAGAMGEEERKFMQKLADTEPIQANANNTPPATPGASAGPTASSAGSGSRPNGLVLPNDPSFNIPRDRS